MKLWNCSENISLCPLVEIVEENLSHKLFLLNGNSCGPAAAAKFVQIAEFVTGQPLHG